MKTKLWKIQKIIRIAAAIGLLNGLPASAQQPPSALPASSAATSPTPQPDPLSDPVLSTSAPAGLSATLSADEVTASGTVIGDGSMVELVVVNNGTRSLLVDGDRAIVLGKPRIPAESRDQVIPPPRRQQLTSDAKEVALSLGTDGVSTEIEDVIRRVKTPLYYGSDQTRRNLAEVRFGARIVFPGDSTKGRVWLSSKISAPVDLVLPVVTQPEGKEVGTLTVHVFPPRHPAPPPPVPVKKLKTEH